jgi:hypothetical protein
MQPKKPVKKEPKELGRLGEKVKEAGEKGAEETKKAVQKAKEKID